MRKFIILISSFILAVNAAEPDKVKAHACMMVFSFLFLLATSIFIARYLKFENFQIFKRDKWFYYHSTFNVLVGIVAWISFLVILSEKDWEWVPNDGRLSYTHSIIGMLTLSLIAVQILIGLFGRPDVNSSKRIFFQLYHTKFGWIIFTLAIITIFLGVNIDRMNLGSIGWGLMLGWTLSFIILCAILETVRLLLNNTEFKEPIEFTVFNVFLLLIFTFMLTLFILIIKSDVK